MRWVSNFHFFRDGHEKTRFALIPYTISTSLPDKDGCLLESDVGRDPSYILYFGRDPRCLRLGLSRKGYDVATNCSLIPDIIFCPAKMSILL